MKRRSQNNPATKISNAPNIFCLNCLQKLKHKLFSAKHPTLPTKIYSYYICDNCKLIQIHPLPYNYQLEKFYNFRNPHIHNVSSNPQINFINQLPMGKKFLEKYHYWIAKNRYKHILQLKKVGSILDIGCSDGLFLTNFDSEKWEVAGIELNKNVAKLAKAKFKHACIYHSPLESFKTQQTFDIITLWHVFEHLRNPKLALKKLHKLLKKNGVLVIEVPNGESLNRKIFGPYWQQLLMPKHLCFWSKKSFQNSLEIAGFRLLKVSYFGIFSFSAASSIANFLRSKGVSSYLAILFVIFLSPLIIVFNFFSFNWRENMLVIAKKTK